MPKAKLLGLEYGPGVLDSINLSLSLARESEFALWFQGVKGVTFGIGNLVGVGMIIWFFLQISLFIY
jgi:hypothetical protein